MKTAHKSFFIIVISSIIFLIIIPLSVFADENDSFKTTYDARYIPLLNGDSEVNLSISIVNTRSDVYVKEFSLAFPSQFSMSNLFVKDDYENIIPVINRQEEFTKISIAFSHPPIGKNAIGHIYMNFVQKNLFKTEGAIWEIILPTIDNKPNTIFNVSITLPEDSTRILSIAKPKPSQIIGNTIFWKEVKTRTIYAVFGDTQYYTLNLTYTLKNEGLRPVYYDIALPPPTVYQDIVINSLEPEPEKVYFDDDYNILARYTLSVKEEKKISLKGEVSLFVHPQIDMNSINAQNISLQKKYLLETTEYWDSGNVGNTDIINNLSTAESIYRYVTSHLTYDYSRINNNKGRLGASVILSDPKTAVCTEFTDLFIALSRKKGILTREIEGYGFSQDQNLRPLSSITDILHTWPEYYDDTKSQWIPIDPTWENTSGIDYFSSFDLNHIVFVIHGKDQSYPLPVGMYKVTDTAKDIEIAPSAKIPEKKIAVQLNENIKREITDTTQYKGVVKIKNIGTSFLRNVALELKSNILVIDKPKITFDLFAPYQTKEIYFTYRARSVTQKKKADLSLFFNTHPIRVIPMTITSFYADIALKAMGIVGGITIFIFIYILYHMKKKKI